jgi:hypothetical protein
MQEKYQEKRYGKEEQKRRRVIDPQLECYEMQEPAPGRKDNQYNGGCQPDKAVAFLKVVAPDEFNDRKENKPAHNDCNDFDNI